LPHPEEAQSAVSKGDARYWMGFRPLGDHPWRDMPFSDSTVCRQRAHDGL